MHLLGLTDHQLSATADELLERFLTVGAGFVQVVGIAAKPDNRIDRVKPQHVFRQIMGMEQNRHDIFHRADGVIVIQPRRPARAVGDAENQLLAARSLELPVIGIQIVERQAHGKRLDLFRVAAGVGPRGDVDRSTFWSASIDCVGNPWSVGWGTK